jgi:hypothetical protein
MQGNDGKFKPEHVANGLKRHTQTIPVIPGMNAIAFIRRSRAKAASTSSDNGEAVAQG